MNYIFRTKIFFRPTLFWTKYLLNQNCLSGPNIFSFQIFSHTKFVSNKTKVIVFGLVKMSISKIWKPNSCPENQMHARQKRLVFDGDHPKKTSWLNWFLWLKTADQISASYLAQKWPKSLQWVGGWWVLKQTLVFSLPSGTKIHVKKL